MLKEHPAPGTLCSAVRTSWAGIAGLALLASGCEEPRGPGSITEGQQQPSLPDAVSATDYPIVFRSDRAEPGVDDLYVMAPDAGDARQLTQGGEFALPRWSPDGATIVFRRQIDGVSAEVGLISPGGDELVLLTSGEPPTRIENAANWSPEGEWIAFASPAGATDPALTRIWKVSRDGGQQQRLFPELEVRQAESAWAPDGVRIAYSEVINGAIREIWLLEEGRATNLTEGRVFAPNFMVWSPDGTRLAFSAFLLGETGEPVHGQGSAPNEDVFVLRVDDRELTQITHHEATDRAPAWTPDGNELLFTSDRDGDADLWLVQLDDVENPRNLINDDDAPHQDAFAHWYLGSP